MTNATATVIHYPGQCMEVHGLVIQQLVEVYCWRTNEVLLSSRSAVGDDHGGNGEWWRRYAVDHSTALICYSEFTSGPLYITPVRSYSRDNTIFTFFPAMLDHWYQKYIVYFNIIILIKPGGN